ncbi:MAG: NAD+ synthase [Planctomycetota bacterium]
MRIGLAQIDTTVGDLVRNSKKLIAAYREAVRAGAELVVFPELTLTGYPPKDLLESSEFIEANLRALDAVTKEIGAVPALVGFAEPNPAERGKPLFNSAAWIENGSIRGVHRKMLLPTYDVFDEDRYFETGRTPLVVEYGGRKIGITICEDVWTDGLSRSLYEVDPVAELKKQGAELAINLSSSPFEVEKDALRHRLVCKHAKMHSLPFVYVNLIGGNDDLVFDGNSFVCDANGVVTHSLASFAEEIRVIDVDAAPESPPAPLPETLDSVFRALVLGTRDYAHKCGFRTAVLGLSGGIDSALTAAIAARAFGPENVLGVTMPSRYSSSGSVDDSVALAKNLAIRLQTIPIEGIFSSFLEALAPEFEGLAPDVTEENLQARIRGSLLMAISNKRGCLLLSTGNKSEMAVGYCTLYGDMNGGLAVISDVPKTMVYDLCRFLNRSGEVIPESTITKPPSAELRPDQKDTDSLPDYEILDPLLRRVVEERAGRDELIAEGHDPALVDRIVGMVDRNEYKRKQAAPGLKVTSKAFGTGRRIPLAMRRSGFRPEDLQA